MEEERELEGSAKRDNESKRNYPFVSLFVCFLRKEGEKAKEGARKAWRVSNRGRGKERGGLGMSSRGCGRAEC